MTAFERRARDFIASRASPHTRAAYEHDLALWLAHCAASGVDPTDPTLECAVRFRDGLVAKFENLTIRRVLSALSKIYRKAQAGQDPAVRWNPFESETLPRPPATSFAGTEAVSDDVAQAVIASAERSSSPRDAAIVRLLYGTGLRRFSVVRLRREDVFQRGEATIARVIVKGSRKEEVQLTPDVAAALSRWLRHAPPSEWAFPNLRKPENRISEPVVNKIVSACAKRAGVAHVHPHQFRAAYVTSALDAGVPLHEVQAAVHHADPKTTQRYDRGRRGTGVAAAVAKHRGITKPKGTP